MNTEAIITRRAFVVTRDDMDSTLTRVQAYLPSNYEARIVGDEILIEGYDSCGWTLDDYVLPRLASGLIFALEILTDGGFIALDDDAEVGSCEKCGQPVYYGDGKRYGTVYHFACWLAVK